MRNLFLTADVIGGWGGGSTVTYHESEALKKLGLCDVVERKDLEWHGQEPWKWDDNAQSIKDYFVLRYKLAHVYSGTFSKTVSRLKQNGTKVVWTIAAHDLPASRREHEKFGVDFASLYPHLCEPNLWKKYIEGYRLADVIVCPSKASIKSVRAYGGDFETKRIELIPHGCTLPEKIKPVPKYFTVGYLGSFGLDKGVIYLLQAWKKLAYNDAVLVLAGKDSASEHVMQMLDRFGGGSVSMLGWIKNPTDFYNQISLYCQSSQTEGFGLEVLEAAAHGRAVICSTGAGAADIIPEDKTGMRFAPGDVDWIAGLIDNAKKNWDLQKVGEEMRNIARAYTWDIVEQKYIDLWRSLL